MTKVCFVCLGNICRSPMAELILKDMLKKRKIEGFEVISRATSACEVGSPIYTPAKRMLAEHGIYGDHIAKQITRLDVLNSDYVLVMDENNLEQVQRFCGELDKGKVFKLMSFCDEVKDIADPWYTNDFQTAFEEISRGCEKFLDTVVV